LADLGLPAEVPVALDHAARSTLENLLHCRALLGGDAGHVAVVSNRYHVARIAWLLRSLGLDWSVAAAEPAWRGTPATWAAALREAAALLAIAGPAPARIDPAPLLPKRPEAGVARAARAWRATPVPWPAAVRGAAALLAIAGRAAARVDPATLLRKRP